MEKNSKGGGVGALYSLRVHTVTHSQEELILNKDIFGHLSPGEYIQVVDPERPGLRLVLKVPATQQQTTGGTLEASLSKIIAEPLNLKPFTRVQIERITPESAEVDFVELTFRRQFLQRGYMWRFKKDMFGRPVHVGQTVTAAGGVQAQVQELGLNGKPTISGVISERTHFVFRSRSARIIWLVQISSEMWDYDQNGDLYFEKFLNKVVAPLFDRWKALAVTHSLTVVFFARTLYLGDVNPTTAPELCAKVRGDQPPIPHSRSLSRVSLPVVLPLSNARTRTRSLVLFLFTSFFHTLPLSLTRTLSHSHTHAPPCSPPCSPPSTPPPTGLTAPPQRRSALPRLLQGGVGERSGRGQGRPPQAAQEGVLGLPQECGVEY